MIHNKYPELALIFENYENLLRQADSVFEAVATNHTQCIKCKPGCSDCCHAMFDLSLVEAMYINQAMQNMEFGPKRSHILSAAGDIDRKTTRLKRNLFRSFRDGASAENIMHDAAKERIACPLLIQGAEGDLCALYEFRPITCRLYGIPTAISGKGHVCGLGGFEAGKNYPTVNIDKIQDKLDELSAKIRDSLNSRFKELHLVYVPLSMALLTEYDANYLGLKNV